MALEKFLPSERDAWTWELARILDVPDIVHMAQQHFQNEIESVFTPDPEIYAKNLSIATIEQGFDRSRCQLIVARDRTTDRLLAYAWLNRNCYMVYAREECAEAAFVHMALDLPLRTRITLTAQILQQWELFCQIWNIPVLVSTTIREDQAGFLNLHREAGFSVRGSFAFKRLKE